MSWIVALLAKLTTGWSLVDFSRGVIVNIFSSILTGGGGKLLSKLKGNKDDEELLLDCFEKAVKANVKNKDIARYIAENDKEHYLAALRKELLTSEHSFSKGTSDAKIVEDFQRELSKTPLFAVKLIKLYGQEACSKSDEVLGKLNEQIREIKKISEQGEKLSLALQNLTAKTGYTLSISDSHMGDFECPIPETPFPRTNIVSDVTAKLVSKGVVYLYGGYKTGKSVLSCLIANGFTDYTKVRIPLEYKNIFSIKEIVLQYDVTEKTIFIVDGVPYQDEAIILDMCRFILSQDKRNWLFILNGRQPLSQFTTSETGIEEISLPQLTVDEITEILPEESKALAQAMTSLSGGNPMIANMMYQMLRSKGWPSNADALYTLFGFSKNASLNDKFRILLRQIIPNRDAVKLLNRLLLVNGPFSRDTIRQLAAVDPTISLPDNCFDELNNVAITASGSGDYSVLPSFSKTLAPDLLPQERSQCDRWLANQILSRKELDELDVLRVLNYLTDGGDYERAGFFYISCLSNLTGDTSSFSLLRGVWIDLPLPNKMSIYLRILIRILQVIKFTNLEERVKLYPAQNLERLLADETIEPNLRHFAYQVLYYFYGTQGNVEKAFRFLEEAKRIPARPELSIVLEEGIWMTLFKVKTEAELYAWMDMYVQQGCPAYDFKEEMCNKAVSNISSTCNDAEAEKKLLAIRTHSENLSAELWPFVVSCEANLIFLYGNLHQGDKALDVYGSSKYAETDFGKIVLNLSMGSILYNEGDKAGAEQYFSRVLEVEKIEVSPINVLYAYVNYAAIRIDQSSQEAVDVLERLRSHPSFDKHYIDSEKVLLYGELAMAFWRNGDRQSSVAWMLKVEEYLWLHRDEKDEAIKKLNMLFDVMVVEYYAEVNNMPRDKKFAKPEPGMFIKTFTSTDDSNASTRACAATIYLYQLQSLYLWTGQYDMTLIDHGLHQFKGRVINERMDCIILFLSIIPELLMSGRISDVVYIIQQSSRAVKNHPDVISHPEGAVLIIPLLYIAAYRLDNLVSSVPFDETTVLGLLSDFTEQHPDDCKFATYLKDMIEGKAQYNIHFSEDAAHQTILLLWHLIDEPSAQQWFVALQRLHITLAGVNPSNPCGKFLETASTNVLYYILKARPSDFDLGRRDSVLARMQKYTLFDRSRAVLSGFYYLMKNPPALSKEVEDLIDL